jgi:[acyl-carrier-protein] S-malonyltransferase
MRKVALLFAGQGAQSVGMGRDIPEAVELFARADALLGIDLAKVTFEGPAETLTRTAYCQPALYVHGLACLEALKSRVPNLSVVATAGLSLGEFTAHAAAGTFDFETGLKLVARRGALMDDACAATTGAMAAMIGGDIADIRRLADDCNIDIANLNAPGQIVVSGDKAGVESAVARAKEFGVRKAVPLSVAGAYHSRLMASAQARFGEDIDAVPLVMPPIPVPANVLGAPARDIAELRDSLIRQVTGTVRWVECIEYLLDHAGIDFFIELGPGGVLAGLVGRIRKGVEVLSVSDAAGLDAATARINEVPLAA